MIAQQDYLHFKQNMPIGETIDCELLAFLVGGIERGTIWDMIITSYPEHDFDDSNAIMSRVFGVSSYDAEIVAGANINISYNTTYSSLNYSGLAAIQRALLAQGVTVNYIPELTVIGDPGAYELYVDTADKRLSVNGKKIKATLGGPNELIITAVTISDEDAPEGSLEITEEDAQKLVGIKIV